MEFGKLMKVLGAVTAGCGATAGIVCGIVYHPAGGIVIHGESDATVQNETAGALSYTAKYAGSGKNVTNGIWDAEDLPAALDWNPTTAVISWVANSMHGDYVFKLLCSDGTFFGDLTVHLHMKSSVMHITGNSVNNGHSSTTIGSTAYRAQYNDGTEVENGKWSSPSDLPAGVYLTPGTGQYENEEFLKWNYGSQITPVGTYNIELDATDGDLYATKDTVLNIAPESMSVHITASLYTSDDDFSTKFDVLYNDGVTIPNNLSWTVTDNGTLNTNIHVVYKMDPVTSTNRYFLEWAKETLTINTPHTLVLTAHDNSYIIADAVATTVVNVYASDILIDGDNQSAPVGTTGGLRYTACWDDGEPVPASPGGTTWSQKDPFKEKNSGATLPISLASSDATVDGVVTTQLVVTWPATFTVGEYVGAIQLNVTSAGPFMTVKTIHISITANSLNVTGPTAPACGWTNGGNFQYTAHYDSTTIAPWNPTWSVFATTSKDKLPSGVGITSTGLLTCDPHTAVGSYNLSIRCVDKYNTPYTNFAIVLNIHHDSITISGDATIWFRNRTASTWNTVYAAKYEDGTPIASKNLVWSVVAQSGSKVPAGVTFSSATGKFSATNNTAVGTYNILLKCHDTSDPQCDGQFAIVIKIMHTSLVINRTSLIHGWAGSHSGTWSDNWGGTAKYIARVYYEDGTSADAAAHWSLANTPRTAGMNVEDDGTIWWDAIDWGVTSYYFAVTTLVNDEFGTITSGSDPYLMTFMVDAKPAWIDNGGTFSVKAFNVSGQPVISCDPANNYDIAIGDTANNQLKLILSYKPTSSSSDVYGTTGQMINIISQGGWIAPYNTANTDGANPQKLNFTTGTWGTYSNVCESWVIVQPAGKSQYQTKIYFHNTRYQ